MSQSLYVRARLSLAVVGSEIADMGRGAVGDVSVPMRPGERIKKARRIRLASLTLVERAVLAELSEGASWEIIAEALGLRGGAEEAERIYGPKWTQWLNGELDDEADFGDYSVGMRGDPDLTGTAETLDQWHARHAEPWEEKPVVPGPVTRVLQHTD